MVIIHDRMQFQTEARVCVCVESLQWFLDTQQFGFVLYYLIINTCTLAFLIFFLHQSWTERAKGQTGDAADLKKRKRTERAAEDHQNDLAEVAESCAKKKKSLDPSSKLSAFAFNKN